MFSTLFFLISASPRKLIQIFFFAGLMFLFILIYVKFRRSQPQIYLRNMPSPVPPKDYTTLPEDDQEEAKFFWEFLGMFKEDFEKRGHPLQYRQMIDLLKHGPIQDLKDFSALTLAESKQMLKYTKDAELRQEVYDIILDNLKDTTISDESADLQCKLLLTLDLNDSDREQIISNIEQNSKNYHSIVDKIVLKLKQDHIMDFRG